MQLEISNPEDYHVALYVRLSKEDETEGPSQSVTNQQSLLNAFVRKHGLLVYDTYIDDGFSGTNFDRPAFQRMIRDIETRKINMVITKDLSRLGRDYIMTGHYMERYFPEKQVRYISLLDGIDTGVDSNANDITPFRAIMNDMYAKDISKKIKSVKRDKQRKGLFIGGKPVYGYKMHPTEKNKIVIDEKVAPVVKRIFNMALEGISCRQIAVKLNEERIPTPAIYCGWNMGKKGVYAGLWSSERIAEMLKNETYIGHMVQGKTEKISYKSKKCIVRTPEKWVVVKNTHEPLIAEDTFQKVQILVQSRAHTRNRTYDFLLKGMIVCHECGYPLAVMNRPNAAGKDRLFFVCRTYQRFTKAGACTCHSIKEQLVTKAVVTKVAEVCQGYLHPERLRPIVTAAIANAQRTNRQEVEIQSLRNQIEQKSAHLDSVYMDRLNGLLLGQDFERIYDRMRLERTALEEQLQQLEAQKKSPVSIEKQAENIVQQYLKDACCRRELLVSLIERVELTKDKQVVIKFRFRKPEVIS